MRAGSTSSPAGGGGKWSVHVVACAVLCMLVLLTFHGVLGLDFSPFDDDIAITENPHIRSFSGENLRWMFTDTALTLRYAPLRYVLWTFIYTTTGAGPWGFHLLALVFHLINAMLVYVLALAVLRRLCVRWGVVRPGAPLLAAVGAALWSVHPLRVEVVSWAMMAEYAEAQALAIVSLLLYMRAARRAAGGTSIYRVGAFWGAVLAYLVSVLLYPSAICLPLILPVLDVWLYQRAPGMSTGALVRLALEKFPFFMIALCLGMLTLLGRAASETTIWGAPAGLQEFGVTERVAQVMFVFAYYVWKPLDPVRLAPIYSWLISFDPWQPIFVLSTVGVMAVSVLAWAWRDRRPWLLALWVAHVAVILPVGGYFEASYIPADRYAYLHDVIFGVAIAAALAWGYPHLTPLVRRAGGIAIVGAMAAFVVMSRAQVLTWATGETVFQNVFAELGNHPYRQKVQWRFANWYMFKRQPAEALEWVNKSLELDRTDPSALHIKARALTALGAQEQARNGKTEAARRFAEEAGLTLDKLLGHGPDPELLHWAGSMYALAGRPDLAEARFRLGVRVHPEMLHFRLSLAEVLMAQGRVAEAVEQLDFIERVSPAFAAERQTVLQKWAAETQPASGPAAAPSQ